ncbi:MAG TPA: hypothetical protein VN650_14695, partial [Gemmatimonadaceae bacterium]|nr:hypothetical protein [Gemmatimonadaceae bacterium]
PRATDTVATGTAVTDSDALPVFPSLVALIVVVPGAMEVTKPAESTRATDVALELQTIVRPVSVLPLASRVTALACVVVPATIVEAESDTVTVATGGGLLGGGLLGGGDAGEVTVIVAEPLLPSTTLVMVAEPVDTPVTTPEEASTLATKAFDDCHETVRPVRTPPVASRATAVACVVAPTLTLV